MNGSRKASIALSALCTLCACGGGGASPPATPGALGTPTPLPSLAPVPPSTSGAGVAFSVTVPAGAQRSISIALTKVGTASVSAAPVLANLGAKDAGCLPSSRGTTCSISVDAPTGIDTFVVTNYDGPGQTGAAHGPITVVQSVASVRARRTLTISGTIAAIQLILVPPPVVGVPPLSHQRNVRSNPPTTTTLPLQVVALDATSATIAQPGPYNTPITLTSSVPALTFSVNGGAASATAQLTAATDVVTVTYPSAGFSGSTLSASAGGVTASLTFSTTGFNAVIAPLTGPVQALGSTVQLESGGYASALLTGGTGPYRIGTGGASAGTDCLSNGIANIVGSVPPFLIRVGSGPGTCTFAILDNLGNASQPITVTVFSPLAPPVTTTTNEFSVANNPAYVGGATGFLGLLTTGSSSYQFSVPATAKSQFTAGSYDLQYGLGLTVDNATQPGTYPVTVTDSLGASTTIPVVVHRTGVTRGTVTTDGFNLALAASIEAPTGLTVPLTGFVGTPTTAISCTNPAPTIDTVTSTSVHVTDPADASFGPCTISITDKQSNLAAAPLQLTMRGYQVEPAANSVLSRFSVDATDGSLFHIIGAGGTANLQALTVSGLPPLAVTTVTPTGPSVQLYSTCSPNEATISSAPTTCTADTNGTFNLGLVPTIGGRTSLSMADGLGGLMQFSAGVTTTLLPVL